MRAGVGAGRGGVAPVTKGRSGTARLLAAARRVEAALRRLNPHRALLLKEVAVVGIISVPQAKRLLKAMFEAGLPIRAEPDARSVLPSKCRPLVYSWDAAAEDDDP